MLLSYNELVQLVEDGVITDVQDGAINAASIDVRLGGLFMVEDVPNGQLCVIDLAKRETLSMRKLEVPGDGAYRLYPGHFILAHTMETFNLPNDISAHFMLKSSIGRNGLEHLNSCWCDAGWHGSSLTLELVNVTRQHILQLRPGMFIGQMKFYRHAPVPDHASYATRGRYNNDLTVEQTKP